MIIMKVKIITVVNGICCSLPYLLEQYNNDIVYKNTDACLCSNKIYGKAAVWLVMFKHLSPFMFFFPLI